MKESNGGGSFPAFGEMGSFGVGGWSEGIFRLVFSVGLFWHRLRALGTMKGKRWLRKGMRIGSLSLLVGLMIACVGLMGISGCMSFQLGEEEIKARFDAAEQEGPEYFDHVDAYGTLRVALSVGAGETPVVFVHGSPGSWDNYVDYLSDGDWVDQFYAASVDRPGYGATRPKGAEPSLEVQAKRIHDAIVASPLEVPAIWVGHSLGGPIVARLAADFPESVSGMLLLAPSIDPELEKRRWYNWLASFPLVKWSLSRYWRNSNEEILPLRKELQLLGDQLARVSAPTIVLQGKKDTLVPWENAEYVKQRFENAAVELRYLEEENHFIPWTRPGQVRQAIEDLATRLVENRESTADR